MSYNPSTDFVGLWRTVTGGVAKEEMPGLDFVVAALGRAGLVNVTVASIAPTSNQSTTAWFQPASPSYSAEGALWLWNSTTSAYVAATPALFRQFLEASFGASGASWFTSTGGAPSNTVGSNGDFAIRTDSPGGIYGPKASGAWPATPIPGTSYSQISAALDYAFGTPGQGTLLFRGAAGWQTLAPGSTGQTLTTGGVGANPAWTSLSNTVNSAAFDAAFSSATGSMLYRAVGGWQALGIGAANTFLISNGSAPFWFSLTAMLDSVMSSAQGSILYRNATGWVALAAGTSGYVLTSGGAGANPTWAAAGGGGSVTSAALDSAFGATVGGVLVRGPGGWANVGVGTSGYILTANGAGAAPSWQANNAAAGPASPGSVGSIITLEYTGGSGSMPAYGGTVTGTGNILGLSYMNSGLGSYVPSGQVWKFLGSFPGVGGTGYADCGLWLRVS
jgi:hypothetical protein